MLRAFKAHFKYAAALTLVMLTTTLIAFLWQKHTTSRLHMKPSQLMRSQDVTTENNMVFYNIIGDKGEGLKTQVTRAEQYTIEVKTFTRQSQAENYIDSLTQKGVTAFFTPVLRNGKVQYLVRVGIYPTQEAAEKQAHSFKTAQKLDATVIRLQ